MEQVKNFIIRNKWFLLAIFLLAIAVSLSWYNHSKDSEAERILRENITTLKIELDTAKKEIESQRQTVRREVRYIETNSKTEIKSYTPDDIANRFNTMLREYRSVDSGE